MYLAPYRQFKPVLDTPVTPSIFSWYKKPMSNESANPCQKPVLQDGWVIRHLCREGYAVYTPWAGTGSAMVAAVLENRYVLAVDLEVDHFTGRLRQFQDELNELMQKRGLVVLTDDPTAAAAAAAEGAENEAAAGGVVLPVPASTANQYQSLLTYIDGSTWMLLESPDHDMQKGAVERGFESASQAVKAYFRSMPAREIKAWVNLGKESKMELSLAVLRLKPVSFNWDAARQKLAEEAQQAERAADPFPAPFPAGGGDSGSEGGDRHPLYGVSGVGMEGAEAGGGVGAGGGGGEGGMIGGGNGGAVVGGRSGGVEEVEAGGQGKGAVQSGEVAEAANVPLPESPAV